MGVEERLESIETQLHQIHTLVNSNLTAQMNVSLDATVRELASLRENVALKERAGDAVASEVLQVIKATEARIGELRAQLRDRAQVGD